MKAYEKMQKIVNQLKEESSESEADEECEWLDQSESVTLLENKSASLKPIIKQKLQEKK